MRVDSRAPSSGGRVCALPMLITTDHEMATQQFRICFLAQIRPQVAIVIFTTNNYNENSTDHLVDMHDVLVVRVAPTTSSTPSAPNPFTVSRSVFDGCRHQLGAGKHREWQSIFLANNSQEFEH